MYFILFKQRPFALFLVGSVMSNIGDVVAGLGFLYAAYQLTGSKALTTGIAIAEVLPYLLFGLIGGAISDIMPKVRLMLWLDLGRALLQLLTWALFNNGQMPYPALLAIVFLIQLGGCFFNPAARAVVPETVDESQLTSANALLSIGNNTASVAAPAIAGLLLAFGNLSVFFAADAITYLCSAVCLLGMLGTAQARQTFDKPNSERRGVGEILREVPRRIYQFWLHLKQSPAMLTLFASTFAVVFFSTWAWQVGLLFKAGVSSNQEKQFFSLLLTIYALVGIVVSFVLPYLARVLTFRHYIAGVFWWGLGLTALSAATTKGSIIACVVAVGIAFALTSQSRVYLLQTSLPPTLKGQGFSFAAVMLYLANMLSFSLFGALSEHVAMKNMFLLAGVPLLVGVPVMLLFTRVRVPSALSEHL